jgi:transposase-like protein
MGNAMKNTCRNGHPRTLTNGYTAKSGRWVCRVCKRRRDAKRYDAEYKNPYEDRSLRP